MKRNFNHWRPIALLIMTDIMFPTIKGASITSKNKQRAQHRKQYIFLLMAGPTICWNIANGFRVNEIRPVGYGRKGE